MPPKEKRQSVAAWLKCEKCDCIVSSKDLLQHPQSCPPSLDHFVHPIIKDMTICSLVEEQKPNSTTLKHVPLSEHATLVQMSQQAMQLCRLSIGDPVSVEVNGTRVVRCAWPTPESSLMSVLLTKAGIELLGCKPGDLVRVQNLYSLPVPAGEVLVQLQGPQSTLAEEQVMTLLQRQQQERVFFENNSIGLRYMGLTLKYKVVKVTPVGGDVEVLQKNLKDLSLSSDDVQAPCFRVVPDTVFRVDRSDKQNENFKQTLSQIGGIDDIIEEIEEIVQNVTSSQKCLEGLSPMRGILLHGAPGTGKSLLASALGHTLKVNFVPIPAAEIFSKFYGETESKLKSFFTDATKRAPSLVFIDEVDVLCPKRNSSSSQQEQRVLAALLSELDSLEDHRVVVLAATSRPDSIDPSLRRPGRLDREIELPVPNPPARRQILMKMLDKIENNLSEAQICEIADRAHGYVGADLMALCCQASGKAIKRGGEKVNLNDLDWAMCQVKPSAMREVLVEVPNVQWSDIGGQKDLKLKLQQAIEWPLTHPEAFTRLGIKAPRGVLMYGPPGCSKTMIAKALATESGLNFLSIKGPELFSKWVGESEKAVRTLFRRARQVAPAIVFFDELDALCGKRGESGNESGSNVQERVLAQLLTELDGVESLSNVTVVAATNRPDRIDKALLRPGRLDRIVYVPLPDAATRLEIFSIHKRKTPFGDDVILDSLVEKTDGYSGAEVSAVCHEAALAALQEDITAKQVHSHHFERALVAVTPRTPSSLLEMYSQYRNL